MSGTIHDGWAYKDPAENDPVEEAQAQSPLESAAGTESGDVSHGDRCRCEFCSRELKDDTSINAGYGPVCAQKRNLPWGGPGRTRAEEHGSAPSEQVPSEESRPATTAKPHALPSAPRRSVLAIVGRSVLAIVGSVLWTVCRACYKGGRSFLSWILCTVLPSVGSVLLKVGRWVLTRVRRTRLYRSLSRRWGRLSSARQRLVQVCCAMIAAFGLSMAIFGLADRSETFVDRHGDPMGLQSTVQIQAVNRPVVFQVNTGTPEEITTASPDQRRVLAARAASQILPSAETHLRQVVVIHLKGVPLSFGALSTPERRNLESRLGREAARRYESAVASLLDATIDAVEQEHSRVVLSVLGLPVEPEAAGASLQTVQRTNERYRGLMDRLGPFFPARRFVVFASSLDEKTLARMGMREALRLREGRPVVFQTNLVWQALVDRDGPGYQEYLLARSSSKLDRATPSRQGGADEVIEALLTNDPYAEP